MDTKTRRSDDESSPNSGIHGFLDFTLDAGRQVLLRGAESIRLRPRTYDVLSYLVSHAGRLVSKRELMESVWSDVAVTDDSLVQCLMEIRRALGEDQDVIKTVRGRGYLFDTPVRVVHAAGQPAASVAVADGGQSSPVPASQRRFSTTLLAGTLLGIAMVVTAVLYSGRLSSLRSTGPTKPIHSIAVLPLANLSGDAEQEYFADGLTDELIGQLMKISSLRVISRTSVMRFKGTRKSIAEIARDLDVDAVVEGAVIRSPARVRVSAEVIQANPEKNLWAERYELPPGDVVVVLSTLARRISDAIRTELSPQERTRLAAVRPLDQDTYESYLKGRYYWNKRSEGATQKALEYFRQATERDPRFALAFTGLADSYYSLALPETLQEVMRPTDAFPKARAAVTRALEIDDGLGEAHASLAHIMFQYDRDWAGSEREFKRAIALNPNYPSAHHWYALSLMWRRRPDEALREINQARVLDPLSLVINSNLGFILGAAHRFDEAIDQCRRTIEMESGFAHAHYRLGQIYVMSGRNHEAVAELRQAIALSGQSPRAMAELGLAYARLGNTGEAMGVLADLQARSKQRYVSPFDIALIYSALGDRSRTLEWLELAYKERAPSLNFLTLSPAFDRLRSEPRFTDLIARIGLPPQ